MSSWWQVLHLILNWNISTWQTQKSESQRNLRDSRAMGRSKMGRQSAPEQRSKIRTVFCNPISIWISKTWSFELCSRFSVHAVRVCVLPASLARSCPNSMWMERAKETAATADAQSDEGRHQRKREMCLNILYKYALIVIIYSPSFHWMNLFCAKRLCAFVQKRPFPSCVEDGEVATFDALCALQRNHYLCKWFRVAFSVHNWKVFALLCACCVRSTTKKCGCCR